MVATEASRDEGTRPPGELRRAARALGWGARRGEEGMASPFRRAATQRTAQGAAALRVGAGPGVFFVGPRLRAVPHACLGPPRIHPGPAGNAPGAPPAAWPRARKRAKSDVGDHRTSELTQPGTRMAPVRPGPEGPLRRAAPVQASFARLLALEAPCLRFSGRIRMFGPLRALAAGVAWLCWPPSTGGWPSLPAVGRPGGNAPGALGGPGPYPARPAQNARPRPIYG